MIEELGPDFMGHDIKWQDDDENGFRLELQEYVKRSKNDDPGRIRWGYVFWDNGWHSPLNGGTPIFAGSDFDVPDFQDDPKKIVGGILGFLSLRSGDTDADYFLNYTDRQRAWADERAEELSIYAYDLENPDG